MQDGSKPALQRSAHYRAHAAQLREMAKAERLEGFRNQLLSLADDYERFAESVDRIRPYMPVTDPVTDKG
jgi:hypothetical protein